MVWLKNSSGRALLDDPALVDEDDPVADLAREAHLVGDDDHRHPVAGEVAHHVEHLADHLRVERRGRLVEEHQLRLDRERAGDRDPLLLAAGEVGRVGVGLLGDPDPLEQPPRAVRGPSSRLASSTSSGARVMLSSTVMCGNRLNCWKTIPIWARIA